MKNQSTSQNIYKRSFRLTPKTVIKTDHPDLMAIEVEKTKRAFEIGKRTGFFRVPKVISYDKVKGRAEFDRLYDIISISKMIIWGSANNALFERIGSALAVIHNELELPVYMRRPLPPILSLRQDDTVCFHGDFNIWNVCYDLNNQCLVILDWQMSAIYGDIATCGTRYFDLAFFINATFYVPWIFFFKPFDTYINHFLEGYSENTKHLFSYLDLQKYLKEYTNNRHIDRKMKRSWKSSLLYAPMDNLLLKFINKR